MELNREESFLRNKSREHWLKEGDRNNAYFSPVLKDRYRRDTFRIKESDGSFTTDKDQIMNRAVDHFSLRFTERHHQMTEEVLSCIKPVVTCNIP